MSPITAVQTVRLAGPGTGDPQSFVLPLVWLTATLLHAHKTVFTLYIAPLFATCDINDAWRQTFFRIPQTAIKAYSSCTTACQGAHHQAFYKQEQSPVVLFHCLTLNTPPLCALFVFNNSPIQQQHYKSESYNKKRHNSPTFSGLSCSMYIVFMCFSPPPSVSLCPYRSLCH